jgi:hypothetical protein
MQERLQADTYDNTPLVDSTSQTRFHDNHTIQNSAVFLYMVRSTESQMQYAHLSGYAHRTVPELSTQHDFTQSIHWAHTLPHMSVHMRDAR